MKKKKSLVEKILQFFFILGSILLSIGLASLLLIILFNLNLPIIFIIFFMVGSIIAGLSGPLLAVCIYKRHKKERKLVKIPSKWVAWFNVISWLGFIFFMGYSFGRGNLLRGWILLIIWVILILFNYLYIRKTIKNKSRKKLKEGK